MGPSPTEDVLDEARDDRLDDDAGEVAEGWSLGVNLLRVFLVRDCSEAEKNPEKAGEWESCLCGLRVLWRGVLSVSTNLNSR